MCAMHNRKQKKLVLKTRGILKNGCDLCVVHNSVLLLSAFFFHRSHSSTCSSVETDCVIISPSEHQYQACNNVFPEPTDCHAAQCPIHQRYGRFTAVQRRREEGAMLTKGNLKTIKTIKPIRISKKQIWCMRNIII